MIKYLSFAIRNSTAKEALYGNGPQNRHRGMDCDHLGRRHHTCAAGAVRRLIQGAGVEQRPRHVGQDFRGAGAPRAMGERMTSGDGTGRFIIRTRFSKKDLVYVAGLFTSTYVDEYEYREKGYQPAFEDLPRKSDHSVEVDTKSSAAAYSSTEP